MCGLDLILIHSWSQWKGADLHLPRLCRVDFHSGMFLHHPSFMYPHHPSPLNWGRPQWNLWFLVTEISCVVGSSCSWVTSTDSFGKPDWVLSSVGVLVSQERQHLLLENSSSHGDVEGRQSFGSPQMEGHMISASTGSSCGWQQQEPAGWGLRHRSLKYCRMLVLVPNAGVPCQWTRVTKSHIMNVSCLSCVWMYPVNSQTL